MQKSNDSSMVRRHWRCPCLGTSVRETERQEFRMLALFVPKKYNYRLHANSDHTLEARFRYRGRCLCPVMMLAKLLSGIWEYLDLPEG